MAEFETRQVLVGHEDVWRALRVWVRARELLLSEVSGWDAVPTYCLGLTTGFHGGSLT